MNDRITVSGVEVFARHGVLESEAEGQPFVVDVGLELDLSAAGKSDDIGDTVDYGDLASRIHRTVADERWNLIERVAERVAEVVLDDHRVMAVEVTVHKPRAPMPVAFDDVTVTIRRSR